VLHQLQRIVFRGLLNMLDAADQAIYLFAGVFAAFGFRGFGCAGTALAIIGLGSQAILAAGGMSGTNALAGGGTGTCGANESSGYTNGKLRKRLG
jgi:hypothetical protein